MDTDETAVLEALSAVLSRLTDNPYDLSLHVDYVRLARETGMEDQIQSALDMVTAFWAAGDHIWLPLIEYKTQSGNLDSSQDLRDILSLYERAEQDYLSISLLQKHINFLIDRYDYFNSGEVRPSDMGDLFSPEWTSAALSSVVTKGIGHLTQSHLLWDTQRDWELERLQNATPEAREVLVDQIESLLLERLQQPHSNNDETFQAYSTFTTSYKSPDQYEPLLVKASKLRSQAKKAFERRETYESSLAQAGFSLEGYAYYIAAERRKGTLDFFVLITLYERAIAEADRRRWTGEVGAEEAMRSFWTGYLDLLRLQHTDEEVRMATFQRAVRSVPASGEVWARYMRFLEQISDPDSNADPRMFEAYDKTKTIPSLQGDVEQLVPVAIARIGYEKRLVEAGKTGEAGFDNLIEIIMDGIVRVRQASSAGDPRLRIEKYFSAICDKLAGLTEHAIILWEDAAKHYKTSYLAWTAYTDVLTKQGLYEDARKVFKDICAKNIDWPEAIWEAWVDFEQLYGSVEEIEESMDRIERAQIQTAAKRAKEMEKAEYAAMQLIAEQQANAVHVSDVPTPANTQSQSGPTPMDVYDDQATENTGGTKRKADDDMDTSDSKKPRIEQKPPQLKRDRENCTVFVADLPAGTTEDSLSSLFKDCGSIREIKITQLPNSLVATVEFMERESVPAALTKDKKRIQEEEIAVHLAWQSTLYVTNFPEKADDAFVRNLFSKYGTIFDVRWPSKKFKSTRRFSYVQYTSLSSAQAALELHGRELEPGLSLNVFISNPERKKERTDSGANDREIYVAGLSRFATKEDLDALFRTYGPIKEVRMALDDKGRAKGFAFVEFEREQDALAALGANNHELKKRRIAVTLADTRNRAKNRDPNVRISVLDRTVRVRNLPLNTQEGLLQQFLAKLAPVKRVEVFSDIAQAEVELENAADVGKLLLRPDPIIYDGNTLELLAETTGGSSTSRPTGSVPSTHGLFVPRSAVSRPRAGLGSKKRVATVSAATSSNGAASPAVKRAETSQREQSKGQDDFRKMLSGDR